MHLSIYIEAGMEDGAQIIFARKGEEHPNYKTGNLILILRQRGNSKFTRQKNNLSTTLTISLKVNLIGGIM